MTFFTETVGITVTRVQRYFNAANQLIDSFDYVAGTTSFYYDGNGNLVEQLPPGAYISHWYTYNQRNLLTSQGRSQLAENITIASFGYDGAGHRLTQTDHTTPGGPTTTTYTNDILGLSQVLAADDGSIQVYNVFGLDLLYQDNDGETRTLLADGLGSVRVEMVDAAIESITTYEPYGSLLARTGVSETSYGFTGEQEDTTTSLLYLRARYYNPALHTFMTKDPWSGNMQKSISMHGYAYGYNSPPNLTDPSGFDPWWCEGRPNSEACNQNWVQSYQPSPSTGFDKFSNWQMPGIDNQLLGWWYVIFFSPEYPYYTEWGTTLTCSIGEGAQLGGSYEETAGFYGFRNFSDAFLCGVLGSQENCQPSGYSVPYQEQTHYAGTAGVGGSIPYIASAGAGGYTQMNSSGQIDEIGLQGGVTLGNTFSAGGLVATTETDSSVELYIPQFQHPSAVNGIANNSLQLAGFPSCSSTSIVTFGAVVDTIAVAVPAARYHQLQAQGYTTMDIAGLDFPDSVPSNYYVKHQALVFAPNDIQLTAYHLGWPDVKNPYTEYGDGVGGGNILRSPYDENPPLCGGWYPSYAFPNP